MSCLHDIIVACTRSAIKVWQITIYLCLRYSTEFESGVHNAFFNISIIAMKKYNGKELYKGLLFIKSMMSMNNVNRQKELDQTYALSVGIECEQIVVDDGASTAVDRPQMRQLMEILEISDYKVLVVEDIYEITRNPEDLKSMIDRINDLGVTIFDLGTMSARYNNYAIEC